MSFNRENVIWESKDGSWNRGFFATYDIGDRFSEDFDPEWDVSYDHSSFEWVSTGHMTEAQAESSWHGANPGSKEVSPYKGNSATNKQYDLMAEWKKNPAAKKKHDRLVHNKNVREHFKQLQETFDKEDGYKTKNVNVVFKLDKDVYDSTGISQSFSGKLNPSDGWLGIHTRDGFKKVYNTATNKFEKNVHRISIRRF